MKVSEVKHHKNHDHFTFKDLFSDKGNRFILVALTIIPLLIFWQTTRFEFLWDDIDIHIINNPYFNPLSFKNLLLLWVEVYAGLYIPVTDSLWALIKITSSWLGLNPYDASLYHMANVILHTLNGLMVYTLVRQFIQNKWAAFAGALLFLIHPLQVEPVAWVSEFRGLLATFFGFLSLLCYLESCYIKNRNGNKNTSRRYYIISLVLFICALLSKPSAVVIPLFMAIFDYYLFRSSLKQIISRLWLWGLPVLAVSLITSSVQDNTQTFSLWARPLIVLNTISFYLYKLLLPVRLSGCYALTPDYLIGQWWFYVTWIVPVVIIAVLWLIRKRFPLLIVAFLLFVSGFLPVSGLIRFMYQEWSTVADRYMYLSVFGASLAFAVFADWCFLHKKQWTVFLLAILLFWVGITSFVQIPVWKNPVIFWSHVLKYAPSESRAYYNRGLAYVRLNKDEPAIQDFTDAINTGLTSAYNNRGGVYLRTGAFQPAIDDFTRAISINPKNEKAYYNRGCAYLKLKKYLLSISDFDQALLLNPSYEKALMSRNAAYSELKKPEVDAAIQSTSDQKLPEKQDQTFYDLGNSLAQQGKFTLAIHYYTQAINQNPKLEDAYTNRGNCYSELKDFAKAIKDYKQVLKLNPSSVMILNNIATSYFFLGNKDQACEYWKKGKDLNDKESTAAYMLHCK